MVVSDLPTKVIDSLYRYQTKERILPKFAVFLAIYQLKSDNISDIRLILIYSDSDGCKFSVLLLLLVCTVYTM